MEAPGVGLGRSRIFPLYSEPRVIGGVLQQAMTEREYVIFLRLFFTDRELNHREPGESEYYFRKAFRRIDDDNDGLLSYYDFTRAMIDLNSLYPERNLNLTFRQVRAHHTQNDMRQLVAAQGPIGAQGAQGTQGSVGAQGATGAIEAQGHLKEAQEVTPIVQDDQATIQALFSFFDFDESGGLDRTELENFFANIPYEDIYNEDIFNHFDSNNDGSLSSEEFTQLLLSLDGYLRGRGITNFVAFVRQIVAPEQVVTQPIEQPAAVFVSQIPSPDNEVPGTRHTYGELGEAFLLQRGYTVDNTSCNAVHHATSHLRNAALGFEILNDFCESVGRGHQTLTYHPTEQQKIDLEETIMENLMNFLSRSEISAFRDENRRRNMIMGIIEVFRLYYDIILAAGDVEYSGYVVFDLVFTFFHVQSEEFQTLWAENFVTDSIEAYNARIATYQPGQSISCGGGIVERSLMAIGNILSTGSGTEPNAAAAVAAVAVLTPAEILSARNVRRTGLLSRWLELYSRENEEEGRDNTVEELRAFINRKIQESDEDNNPNDWRDDVTTLVESEGVRMMMEGGARKYPRRINIFNVLFGKKQRKLLKRTSKTKYTKKNKEKMGKTKRMRKYKKKITQHAKKSTHKKEFL